MNKSQEQAIVWLFLMPIGAAIGGGLIVGLVFVEGPSIRRTLELGLFAVFAGSWWIWQFLSVAIFSKKKKKVIFDERDFIIRKKAALAGYLGLWLYFVLACITPWWVVGPNKNISTNILPLILIGGIIFFHIILNLAILIQYWSGGKGGE
jgi:hypothetical protein